MSFSNDVKKELYPLIAKPRHCQLAELSAFVLIFGCLFPTGEGLSFSIDSENEEIIRKCFTLLSKTISISGCETVLPPRETGELLEALKFSLGDEKIDGVLLMQPCCKKAFLRGAFLAAGSVSNPSKGYHFEIVMPSKAAAEQLSEVIRFFEVDAKIVERRNSFAVYVKESEQIIRLLGLMGANAAYLNFENVRIEKEMRNSINRRVNCETANIGKTITASMRQLEDIRLIERERGLSSLPRNLQEIAQLRIDQPDASLSDLGNLLHPPVGKSGVNHRLRRIGEIAKTIRGE